MINRKEFVSFMIEAGVLTFGDFVTKSGRKTPYFVNTGNYRTGAHLSRLGAYYADLVAEVASENGMPTLANMIILGKVIKETGVIPFENVERALKKVISAKRADMLDINMKALKLGYDYEG